MKLFSAVQIREWDAATIKAQQISSHSLMQRAADACTRRMLSYADRNQPIHIYCGMGNNGGDGLLVGLHLLIMGFDARVFVVRHQEQFSSDAAESLAQLKEKFPDAINDIQKSSDLIKETPFLTVDCLLGTGLNKPVEGLLGETIDHMNSTKRFTISVDIPSGLFADKSSSENKHIVRCDLCLTFQTPKLSFLLSENQHFVPRFEVIKIGLDPDAIQRVSTDKYFITADDAKSLITARSRFSHKGTFGHALLVAGSLGKSGAAVISAKSCLRSGAGLLTVHSNASTLNGILHHLPEAMTSEDEHSDFITQIELKTNYSAIAIGPGIGTEEDTQLVLKKLLNYYQGKLVIDADGINILAENKTWLSFLPPSTILTPHPKEFERLTEKTTDDFERLKLAKEFSIKHNCILVLKNAFSCVAMPDGNLFFNSTGNPGLAKGGSGDALTGIILGLLARGYNPPKAALLGTYIHGLAADLCVKEQSMESILASDVIEKLPMAFMELEKQSSSRN